MPLRPIGDIALSPQTRYITGGRCPQPLHTRIPRGDETIVVGDIVLDEPLKGKQRSAPMSCLTYLRWGLACTSTPYRGLHTQQPDAHLARVDALEADADVRRRNP